MAARIENHWWREGWRLVRERLPGIVTTRRRLVLAAVVVLSVVIGVIGGLLLFSLVDDDGVPGWPAGVALGLFAAYLAVTICGMVWARRDRQPEYRGGRVSVGIESLLDLRKPLPESSPEELLEEARTHVRRARGAVPIQFLLSGSATIIMLTVILLFLATGWWGPSSWTFLALLLLNMGQPLIWLKTLGSTTAQLARLDRIPVADAPTYRGPKAWGIEAPRKAAGDGPSPG